MVVTTLMVVSATLFGMFVILFIVSFVQNGVKMLITHYFNAKLEYDKQSLDYHLASIHDEKAPYDNPRVYSKK